MRTHKPCAKKQLIRARTFYPRPCRACARNSHTRTLRNRTLCAHDGPELIPQTNRGTPVHNEHKPHRFELPIEYLRYSPLLKLHQICVTCTPGAYYSVITPKLIQLSRYYLLRRTDTLTVPLASTYKQDRLVVGGQTIPTYK